MGFSMRIRAALCLFALSSSSSTHAQWLDVYDTEHSVTSSAATPLLQNVSCQPELVNHPLELQDAILQAICANPLARKAWASARAQAAAVGVSEAAYLPTLNAAAGIERDTLATTYNGGGFGNITASQNSSSKYGSLNLSWVLFDFGKRSAALRQARELLAATNATQDDVLQTVFFNAAVAFYAVSDAQATVEAAQQTEDIARESLAEASAKHDAGAGTLSDQLQAQTAYRRAIIDRVNAEGRERTMMGMLATTMGLDANEPLKIAPAGPATDNAAFERNVDQLIDDAKATQPKLVAARAELDAARANIDAVRAQGRPTISLVGSLTKNNPSYQQQPEQLPIVRSRGSTIGVQVTIPLFDGFSSRYRIAEAEAQADAQEAGMKNTELQVSLDVWRSYQSLQADVENLENSKALLDDAQRSLEIARGRYKSGVGTFTELSNAQTALADARKQRVVAVSNWSTDRLGLAKSLGNLGLWAAR